MTCNEFLKSMIAEFGPLEWRATSGNYVKTSKGWPSSPRHPVNRRDEDERQGYLVQME